MNDECKIWTREQIEAVSPEEIETTRTAVLNQIRPLLADHHPIVQGMVLAELAATFLAGHHPDDRPALLHMLVRTIESLTPVIADQLDLFPEYQS